VRLFVAVDVPEDAVEHLDAEVAQLRDAYREPRWVPSGRWHLTLAFLGEVDEDTFDRLATRLERVGRRHRPLTLHFAGAGRFSSRVLWAGVQGDRDELRHLAGSVSAAARKAGVLVDDRVHRPHVTLARGRTTSLDLRPLVAALVHYEGPDWVAGSISLVRSHLGPDPRYEVLRSWPLGGGASPPG
jgi:2'-5' RNA ligase